MGSLEQRGTWCECGGAAVEGPLSQLRCCQWDPWSGSCMAGMEFPSWEVSFTLLPLQTQTKPKKLQHLGEAEFYLGQAVSHQHQFHTNWQIPSPPLSLQAASAVPGCPVRGTLQVTRAPPFSHRAPHDSLCVCVWLLTGNTALLAASKNSLFIQTLHLWRRDSPVPQCCSRNSETPA